MGSIRQPQPVKLFVGMLSARRDLMNRARELLVPRCGKTDLQSDYWAFDQTDYYRAELGTGVEKHFLSFRNLIAAEGLPDIKIATNELEQMLCSELAQPANRRPVNLDPGYLSLSKVVLATTKDHAHRIYLQQGIYAEVTLHYRDGRWLPWPWTYPDYASGDYMAFFDHMRRVLRTQLPHEAKKHGDQR